MNRYLFEVDYSADSIRWLRITNDKFKKTPEQLQKLQEKIIQERDCALAYFFTLKFSLQPHLMQKLILDEKDAKYAFLFAQNIPHCDIKALQKVVTDSKKIKYICKFACFVPEADLQPLQELIIQSKNVKYVHMLLKHVQSSQVDELKHIILESKKPRYLFELAKHTKDLDLLRQIEDLIIESKSFTYLRLMAEKIKTANVDKLEEAVLDSGNEAEIKKFAKYVKKSKMKNFLLVS